MVLTECQGLFEKMISEEKLEVGKGTSHVCMWSKIGPRKGNLMCKGMEVGVCLVSSWNSQDTSVAKQLEQEEAEYQVGQEVPDAATGAGGQLLDL